MNASALDPYSRRQIAEIKPVIAMLLGPTTRRRQDRFLRVNGAANLTGLPGMSIRFGTSHAGRPIGVQLVAPWLAEDQLLPCRRLA